MTIEYSEIDDRFDNTNKVIELIKDNLNLRANRTNSLEEDNAVSVSAHYDYLSYGELRQVGDGTQTVNVNLTEKITYGANTATPFIRTLNRAQDNLLRASSITLMAGTTTEHQINYGFDTAGRLSTITAADPNGGAAKVHTYGYLANSGNLIETITSPAHKVTNTYEADRNGLLSKQNSKLDNTLIGSYQYAMNSLGQRTSITKNGLAYPAATVETVGYDSKGQVVKTTDNTTATNNRLYTFDAIGNRLTSQDGSVGVSPASTYTVNAVNEITNITTSNTTINTTHDDDGNMLTGTLPEDANGATLVWDAQNRLTKITKSDNTVIEYAYDYQSRRISKTVGTTKTSWIYNGWNPIAEYSNTTLTKTLTWGQDINGGIQSGGGVGGLLQETHHYPPLNSHYYPLYDGNGNITDYINTAAAVLAHYQYDAFGNTIVKTGFKANDFAHRFSTKQRGTETGLYYYGYRYYDPVTGRWPSRDPIGENGGVNLYGFVGNNPVGRWDRLGLYPGSEGHGEQISPSASYSLIKKIQRNGDMQFSTLVFLAPEINNINSDLSYLRNIYRLIKYYKLIGTDSNNKFVYTCKYGWIDHGHFMNNAMITYVAALNNVRKGNKNPMLAAEKGRETAAIASFLNEIGQTIVVSPSAWTREDLISNSLGRDMGVAMVKHDFPKIGFAKANIKFVNPANSMMKKSQFYDISAHWNKLLIESGAVKYGSGVKVLGKTPEKWFGDEAIDVLKNGPPIAYTIKGALKGYRNTLMHRCLCDGDKPRLKAHIYTGK